MIISVHYFNSGTLVLKIKSCFLNSLSLIKYFYIIQYNFLNKIEKQNEIEKQR